MKGGSSSKTTAAVFSDHPDRARPERVIVATGRFVGEGFDNPRLDSLFLTMPISWSGTLVQYAGRVQRLHEAKREVRIYDCAVVKMKNAGKRSEWLPRVRAPMLPTSYLERENAAAQSILSLVEVKK
jgi:superfamily II DNA or RNA helicase